MTTLWIMWDALRKLFHRPAIRTGLARDPRSRLRDPRFVSFIAASNRKSVDTNFQDTVLRARKLARQAFVVLAVAAAIWIALESARALSVF
jgi:hypothetical protein